MHIPDGFIDLKTVATTTALSAGSLALAIRHARQVLPPRRVPLLGLSAAFLFAAQMLNFPVVAGTSGHLIGGVLVAALLGPSAAVVVVTAVLIVQCFLFQDGGVLALGANVFNMAVLGACGGWLVFRVVTSVLSGERGRVAAVMFAGWVSTLLASAGCAGQLAWSGRVGWEAAFTAMTGIHLLIGVGEGLISGMVYAAVQRVRPDLVNPAPQPSMTSPGRETILYGLLVSLGLAVFLAPFACPWPDGLEDVAEKLGFLHAATSPSVSALAPDYLFPGITSAPLATAIAGAVGCVVVFSASILLARVLIPAVRRDVPSGGVAP